jgi:ribonuclease HI
VTQPSLFGDEGGAVRDIYVFTDGGSRGNPGPAAIGAVVYDMSETPPRRLAVVSERIGVTTNNVAEYRAVIAGLEAALPFDAQRLHLRADSKLVVEQLRGTWRVKQDHLRPLHEHARSLLARYEDVDVQHVPREENTDADALVNAALDLA